MTFTISAMTKVNGGLFSSSNIVKWKTSRNPSYIIICGTLYKIRRAPYESWRTLSFATRINCFSSEVEINWNCHREEKWKECTRKQVGPKYFMNRHDINEDTKWQHSSNITDDCSQFESTKTIENETSNHWNIVKFPTDLETVDSVRSIPDPMNPETNITIMIKPILRLISPESCSPIVIRATI